MTAEDQAAPPPEWLRRMVRRYRQWQGSEPRTRVELWCELEERAGWRFLPQLIHPGDIVYSFDMGGDLVLEKALLEERAARVYMFDPDPSVRSRAAEELAGPFHLFPTRVGAEDRPALPGGQPRDAQVRRIDTLMRTLGHHRMSLVKVVESAAVTAVHDLAELQVDVRQLLVQIPSQFLDRRARVEAMVASLHRRGYRILHIDPDGTRYTFLRSDLPRP